MKLIQWPVLCQQKMLRGFRNGHQFRIYVAVYLPFKNGLIDWEGYRRILDRIISAGCIPVIVADTSFTFNLTPEQRLEVVRMSLGWYPNITFVIGITATGEHANSSSPEHCLSLIRQIKAEFPEATLIFMLMQFKAMTALHEEALVAFFAAFHEFIIMSHELVPEFVAHGRLWTATEFVGIANLSHVKFGKVSALSGGFHIEQRRQLVMELNLDFEVLSGNDWDVVGAFLFADGILMGLAVAFPAIFMLLLSIDPHGPEGWMFNDLVKVVDAFGAYFFAPNPDIDLADDCILPHDKPETTVVDVGNYKAGLALWFVIIGVITSAEIHPASQTKDGRPSTDERHLRALLVRLKLVLRKIGMTEVEITNLLS